MNRTSLTDLSYVGKHRSRGVRSPSMTRRFSRLIWQIAIPLLLLAGLSIWFRYTDADISLIRGLRAATGITNWQDAELGAWGFIKTYGVIPGFLVTLAAISVIFAGLMSPRFAHWVRPGVYVMLVTAIGSGLISNIIFKNHWGRPRPKQVIELGGDYAFVKVLTPGFELVGKSFPCGHATMGFLFFAVALVLFNRRPLLAWIATALALILGSLLGVARMLQGGHFPSDVLWAAGIMWFTSVGLLRALRLQDFNETPLAIAPPNPRRTRLMAASLAGALVLLVAAALVSVPQIRQQEIPIAAPRSGTPQSFIFDFKGTLRVRAGDASLLQVDFDGCGTPQSKPSLIAGSISTRGTIKVVESSSGFFTEKNFIATLTLAPGEYEIQCGAGVKPVIPRDLGIRRQGGHVWILKIPGATQSSGAP